jgi:hypothetical protein
MLSKTQAFKLAPTLKGIAIYYSMIFLDLGLVLAKDRNSQNFLFAEVSNHISNFAITSLIVGLMSFILALQAAPFKIVIWLGVAAIAMNFVVEVLISIMNTPDVVDAVYGTAGVIFTIAVMYVFNKVGIRPSNKI